MEKMRSSGIPSALYNVHPQTVKACHCRSKEPLVGRDVREDSGSMSHSPGLTGAAEQSWPRGAKCRAPTEPGLQGWAVHSSISFNMHYPVNIPSQISTQLMFRSIFFFFGKTPSYHFSLPSEEELGSNIFSTVHWSICRLLWVILWGAASRPLVCKHALVAHPNCHKSWLSHCSQCLQDELSCT